MQLTQSCAAARGDAPFPVRDGSFGRVTGKSSSGTATGPQEAQCTTGMGVPQKRCLDISQSLSLELVRWPPTLCSLALWVMELKACSLVRPENYTKKRRLKSFIFFRRDNTHQGSPRQSCSTFVSHLRGISAPWTTSDSKLWPQTDPPRCSLGHLPHSRAPQTFNNEKISTGGQASPPWRK